MTSSAQQGGSPPDRFSWKGQVSYDAVVEIEGRNGDVRAESSRSGGVEIVARKRGDARRLHEVTIDVREHEDGVTIKAVYPDPEPPEVLTWAWVKHCWSRMNRSDVRVDFEVRVPAGVRLVCRTANGGIKAALQSNDVEAYTVNGGIRIDTAGSAHAETVNGSIEATFGSLDWQSPLNFQTVNGDITLNAPAGLNARLRAKTTSGKITTEFPMVASGTLGIRQVAGVIGSGGGELSLSTVNGSVSLRRAV